MKITINLQNICNAEDLPALSDIEKWVEAATQCSKDDVEITLRVVDKSEMTDLNHRFRQQNKPTNILSFESELPEPIALDMPFLGDLVICDEVVREEAKKYGLSLQEHWAHLIIHGVLHLRGYDHETDEEAKIMETLESELMQSLGFEDPYEME